MKFKNKYFLIIDLELAYLDCVWKTNNYLKNL